jgi:uncharacterized protein (TIGR03067 family)
MCVKRAVLVPSTVLFLLCVVPAAAEDKDEAIRKELQALQGTWRFQSVRGGDGQERPCTGEVVFSGTQVTFKAITAGEPDDRAPFTIDPTKHPKTMDVGDPWPQGVDKTRLIYELKDDELRLSTGHLGGRPADFSGKNGPVYTLKRVKP